MRKCGRCGAPLGNGLGSDRRIKYCSEECYKSAHREQCRENFRRRYAAKHEEELARYRAYYATHKEAVTEKVREWRVANREVLNAYYREWYRKHKAQME